MVDRINMKRYNLIMETTNNTATPVEIVNALVRFADADMRLARINHSILIGQTIVGTVSLSYHAPSRVYTMTDTDGVEWAKGAAKVMRAALVSSYDVMTEDDAAA